MPDKNEMILVLDDDIAVLERLGRLLRFEGWHNISLCEKAVEIWPILKAERVAVMILDLLMPETDGYMVLQQMKEDFPEVPVIVATALDDLDSVIRSMRAGAFDYVPKSAESSRIIASIGHAITISNLRADNRALRKSLLEDRLEAPDHFKEIISRNRKIAAIFRYVEAISRSDKPILISGESGTGKELFAKAAHAASGRKGEMVTVNIAGLDDTMFSDTLFGHKKGAFTGADSDRPGLIEKAAGGTLFLDEIGDLSPQSQVKLLRLIEQKLYYPLGSDFTRSSDALIITATNINLDSACLDGKFRQDLLYRLDTHHIHLPPLRERYDDLPLLVEFFAEKAARSFEKNKPAIPNELYELLVNHDFPGNIRELESMVFDAVGRNASNILPLESFKNKVFKGQAKQKAEMQHEYSIFSTLSVLPTLKEISEELIKEAMKRTNGNQGVAAGLLGISRTALNRRLSSQSDAE